jgi:hypothetical protein
LHPSGTRMNPSGTLALFPWNLPQKTTCKTP